MSGYCPAIRQDCPYLTPTPEELVEMLGVAKASGLAEGIRRCRDAVEKLVDSHPDINVNAENGWVKLSVILAAIDAMKGE